MRVPFVFLKYEFCSFKDEHNESVTLNVPIIISYAFSLTLDQLIYICQIHMNLHMNAATFSLLNATNQIYSVNCQVLSLRKIRW